MRNKNIWIDSSPLIIAKIRKREGLSYNKALGDMTLSQLKRGLIMGVSDCEDIEDNIDSKTKHDGGTADDGE